MKWSEEQTVNFVKEYIQHECLYNVNSDDYKNKFLRKTALMKLSACMRLPDFDPKDAYLKIRSLKATYFQEIKKIKERYDVATGYVYTPKLKWFAILHDALMAINGGETFKERINIDSTPPPEFYGVEDLVPENNSDSNEETNNNSGACHVEDRVKRKRRISLLGYNNLISKLECSNTRSSKASDKFEHEFDIFGKSIAAQLKNMPLDRAIEAQMFIQNYLSDMRLRALQRTAYTPRSSSSQSDYKV